MKKIVIDTVKKREYIEYVKIFAISILIHWVLVLIGYASMKLSYSDITILNFLGDRFENAGDAIHYTHIAEFGYQSAGDAANKIVFYPLYPLLVKMLWFVVRNYAVAGVIISQVCFGIASIFLYKLTSIEFSKSKAYGAVACMIVYPFSVFTFGIFTEGLFLMLTIMSLYYIRKHNWVLAGIIGFFAALTRMQGMLLIAPALYEYLVEFRKIENVSWRKKIKWKDFTIFCIPLGFIVYLFINKIVQGDFFSFIAHEEAPPWYQTTKWMNENIAKDYNMALENPYLSYVIYWVQVFLFFFAIACLFYGIKKKLRTSYIVFGGIYTCVSFLASWMISGGRYMMGFIPFYLLFASIENPYIKRFILTISTILCVIYTIEFIQGQPIM